MEYKERNWTRESDFTTIGSTTYWMEREYGSSLIYKQFTYALTKLLTTNSQFIHEDHSIHETDFISYFPSMDGMSRVQEPYS